MVSSLRTGPAPRLAKHLPQRDRNGLFGDLGHPILVESFQDLKTLEVWNRRSNIVVQTDMSPFDSLNSCHRCNQLGHRGNPRNRVNRVRRGIGLKVEFSRRPRVQCLAYRPRPSAKQVRRNEWDSDIPPFPLTTNATPDSEPPSLSGDTYWDRI